ncbi:MAG TPA: PepSY domain-containing protein [Treponemataceae bacterium]|nr:PepSY domain-containing protein [Treponemataceae bacterium]
MSVAVLSFSLVALAVSGFAQGKQGKETDATASAALNADAKSGLNQLYTSSLALGATPKITANQAQIAALSANPGTVSSSVELESEYGQLIYSVALNTGAEVKIDAGNGKVLYTGVSSNNDSGRRHDGSDYETNDNEESGKDCNADQAD